jgi:hypothetical protein
MLSSAHGLRLAKFADRHECPAKARSLDAGRGNNIYTREGGNACRRVRQAFRQPIPIAGAAISAGFAHSQVSSIFLVGK